VLRDLHGTKFRSGASTSLSRLGFENATAVATDANGYIYVTGSTSSPDFPLLNATQTVLRGQSLVVSFDSGAVVAPGGI